MPEQPTINITNFNDGQEYIKLIDERIEELKENAWNNGVEYTNVVTPIKKSIISYITQQEDLQNPTKPVVIYNPIIFKINETLYTLNNKTLEDPNDEYTFDIDKPGYIIQKDLGTEVNTTDIAEEDFPEDDFSTDDEATPVMTVATPEENIQNYNIDELKTEKTNTENQIIEFNKEDWAKFVLNLLTFIHDFGPIHFETLYEGNFLLDENTNYGIKIVSSNSIRPSEESLQENEIIIEFKDKYYIVNVNSVNYITFTDLDYNIDISIDNSTDDVLDEDNIYENIDPTPPGENEG